MIDKNMYLQTCARFFQYMKKGRGGIYLGDHTLLGGNVIGQQILTDARHVPSIRTFFTPAPIESSKLALLFHMIKGGMVCADIGAGCGYYSVFLASLAGPHGKIYSFEGIPECFNLLVKNALLNELYAIECINHVLAENVKTIDLSYFETHYQFFFSPAAGYAPKNIRTETSSLDLILEQKNESSLDFIKISHDTDLSKVWNGMQSTLALSPDIKILCRLRPGSSSVLDEIGKAGFRYFLLPTLKEVDKSFLQSQSHPKTVVLSRSSILGSVQQ